MLPAVVFTAGASSLATEICATRLLAPYFGQSTVVWANVIGLILIYLSVGYWLGGRIADRHPTPRVLGLILVIAALCTAVLPFIARPFLNLALQGFAAVSIGTVVGSFLSTLLLFSVPVTLLGMASPFALRLALTDIDRAGRTSGRLSSLATVGAIIGTFGSALVLIPGVGTQRTLLSAALLVALVSIPLLMRPAIIASAVIVVLLILPPGLVKETQGTLAERETTYQFVQVVRESGGRIVMRFDDGIADQSVYRADTALTGGEWDMPLVVPPLLAAHPASACSSSATPAARRRARLARSIPGIDIDAVELDPVVTQLARQYMGLDTIPNLHVITADGREYLETTAKRYDLIVVDAYRTEYIPFYLATQEFFSLMRAHLNPGGGDRAQRRARTRQQRIGRRRSRGPSPRSSRRCGCGRRCTSTSWSSASSDPITATSLARPTHGATSEHRRCSARWWCSRHTSRSRPLTRSPTTARRSSGSRIAPSSPTSRRAARSTNSCCPPRRDGQNVLSDTPLYRGDATGSGRMLHLSTL